VQKRDVMQHRCPIRAAANNGKACHAELGVAASPARGRQFRRSGDLLSWFGGKADSA
jgi:hypothetical protein